MHDFHIALRNAQFSTAQHFCAHFHTNEWECAHILYEYINVYKCIYTDIMSKSDNRQIRYALWTHTFTIYLQHGSAESLQIISSCCLRNESEWHMISNIIKYRILKWMKFSVLCASNKFTCIAYTHNCAKSNNGKNTSEAEQHTHILTQQWRQFDMEIGTWAHTKPHYRK